MTLGDRICQALATYLTNQSIGATVQPSITETVNTQNEARVICRVVSCSDRGAHLRGIFDVVGEVIIRQSIDDTTPKTTFNAICSAVKQLLLDDDTTIAALETIDPQLTIYDRSWFLSSQEEAAGERGFQAIYTWRAVARDTPSTT